MSKPITTFRPPDGWVMDNFSNERWQTPSAFNGRVMVEQFIILAEKVQEPREVYIARLQKLIDENDNMHHMKPIRIKARELGVELDLDFSRWGKTAKR